MAVDVSVCVATWNAAERLGGLLGALLAPPAEGEGADAPRRPTLEVIVVDNASGDGAPERVAAEFPGVRLIRNARNLGFARANNQAAAVARGRALLFLNDDARAGPAAVGALLAYLDARPEAVACGPRLIGPDGAATTSWGELPDLRALLHRIRLLRWTRLFRRAYRRFRRGAPPAGSGPVPRLAGAALLVRASARDALHPEPLWDEGFPFGLEDVDLCLRLRRLGEVHLVSEAEVVHEGGAATARNVAFAYRGYELGYARFLAKHDGRLRATVGYRLLASLDQPVRAARLALAAALQAARGRRAAARRSLVQLGAVLAFLAVGLPRLWFGALRPVPHGAAVARAPDALP